MGAPGRLPEEPGDNRFAACTEDHPLEYLEFSGEIPAGSAAGKMPIWDCGTYETLKWEARKVEVALQGERVDARYALFPIEAGEHPKDWMILHRMDPPDDLGREPMPEHVVPMLAARESYRRETTTSIKWDGVRAIVYSRPGELRLESRNLNDITASYPEFAGLELGSAPTARSSTGRSWCSTRTAARPSGRCSGGCTWQAEPRPGGLRRAHR